MLVGVYQEIKVGYIGSSVGRAEKDSGDSIEELTDLERFVRDTSQLI